MKSRESQPQPGYNSLHRALAVSAIFLASIGSAEVAGHNKDIVRGAINAAKVAINKAGRGDVAAAEKPYSQISLNYIKHPKKIKVMPGDGIYDVIERANGDNDIFSNGPAITAEYKYIEDQAPNGVLQPNQIVKVPPVIPFAEKSAK
jgi:hypothetical protein